MTYRTNLLSVLLVGLVAASCGSSKSPQTVSTSTTQTIQVVTTTTTTSSTTTTNPGVVPAVGIKSYVTTVKSPSLVVNISYPVVGGMASNQIENHINSTVYSAVKGYVSTFQNQLNGLTPPTVPGSADNGANQSQISGSFTKELVDPRYLSFKFLLSSFAAGAASPTTEVESLTFDLKSGKLLSLSDLFNGSKYLTDLSNLARKAIAAKLGRNANQSFINNGTQPKDVNFSGWNLTSSAFEVTFSQGQVAPMASGVVTVDLPYSDLSSIAKNPGPLTNP